jgi:hypothetical protein
MQSLKIELPDAAAMRLRKEAALRKELPDQLGSPLPAEFDITDQEIGLIQSEIDAVPASKRPA